MTMTIDKFNEILDQFGTDPDAWPSADRAACHTLLSTSAAARAALQQHEQLGHVLNQYTVPTFPGLESRVLHQFLPQQAKSVVDRVLDWMIPTQPLSLQFLRPAMAACLPLVFGIVVGNFFSFGVSTENQGFEYWDDELYVLSLNDYTENL